MKKGRGKEKRKERRWKEKRRRKGNEGEHRLAFNFSCNDRGDLNTNVTLSNDTWIHGSGPVDNNLSPNLLN